MKFFLILALTALTSSAFANHHEGTVEEQKARMSQKLDTRIADLQAAKTCVTAATTHDALKACHKELKAKREAAKAEWKSKRKEHKKK